MHDRVNGKIEKSRSHNAEQTMHWLCALRRSLGRTVYAVMVLSSCLILPGVVRAEDGRSYLDVSGGYKTGTFGTPYRSNLGSVSTGLGYVTPVYDVSLTIPYLFLSSQYQGGTNSNSGIGDIVLRGGRVLVAETSSGFSLDGTLAIKLPTADDAKGLGTGQTDIGVFLNAHQHIADLKLSLLGGYMKVGSPSYVNYNDVFLYGFGVSKVFQYTELYVSFEGRNALVSGERNPQEIHAGIFHVLNKEYAIKGSTFVGLNNGGPSFGLDTGVVRWF
jgi:hypothetical protein